MGQRARHIPLSRDVPQRLPNAHRDGEDAVHPAFIHVPRTGGTSLWIALQHAFPNRHGQCIMKTSQIPMFSHECTLTNFTHLSVSTLIDCGIVREDWLRQQWTFAIVRNPWARAVSAWKWRQRIRWPETTLDEFLGQLPHIHPIGAFNNRLPASELNKQTCWLSHKSKWIVDYVMRYEDLANQWQDVCEAMAVISPLPNTRYKGCHREKTERIRKLCKTPWRDFYNARTKQIVADYYAEEIEIFGFRFEG